MAKTILGVDIGHDQLKLALVKGKKVIKTASAEMPENLLKEGRITSRETMSDFIKAAMKKNGIRANHAAFVLPNETVFVKDVSMPLMTVDQLEYNLPFEFNDYITGEPRNYAFDYAVLDINDPSEEQKSADLTGTEADADMDAAPTMDLMAVGVQKEVLEDTQVTLRKAGLRLIKSAPSVCSYISLIRAQSEKLEKVAEEYAILDLGFNAIRMYMFKGDRHLATRVLEIGMSSLDNVLMDAYGVDVHLAHTYLMSNFENCQQREECIATYENIAVELMRALNFYRFSNPDSALSDMWLCGGGVIKPLVDSMGEMLDITLHPAEELIPDGSGIENCNTYAQAIGITMD